MNCSPFSGFFCRSERNEESLLPATVRILNADRNPYRYRCIYVRAGIPDWMDMTNRGVPKDDNPAVLKLLRPYRDSSLRSESQRLQPSQAAVVSPPIMESTSPVM